MTDKQQMVLLHKSAGIYTHKDSIDCECSPRMVTLAEAQKVREAGGFNYITAGDDQSSSPANSE